MDSLPQIAFQSEIEKLDIFSRGMQALETGKISQKAIALGNRYKNTIASAYLADLEIRFINEEIGFGAFAKTPIKKGAFVGEYTGIIRENVRVYFAPLNNYCYEYPILDQLGRSFAIDATHGNLTRFINHSYHPNLKPDYAFFDGFYHLIFIASKEIQKHEQLSYNYGRNYWMLREEPRTLKA